LVEEFIRLDMQRVRVRVPHDLIDANDLPARIAIRQRAAKTEQKDRFTGHGIEVDGPSERNREAWLEVEAIQGVNNIDTPTSGHLHCAVGFGKIDPQSGILALVGNSKKVTGKRPILRVAQIEQHLDACVSKGEGRGRQKDE